MNAVCPGMVNTHILDDIALAITYLLSDAASWVTGQQFVIDGGITIGGGE